jgi:hypothetical protein
MNIPRQYSDSSPSSPDGDNFDAMIRRIFSDPVVRKLIINYVLRARAEADQDWAYVKDWWRNATMEERALVTAVVQREYSDTGIEMMSVLAQLTLDRLRAEVWPGDLSPDSEDSEGSRPSCQS